jgi:hypothetical protein
VALGAVDPAKDLLAAMDEAIFYVLAAPLPGTRMPAYLMHDVGGVDCVLAYTDLEHLVECCGQHQPWLGVRISALMADLRDQRLPGPVVNLPLAPAAHWTAAGPSWDQPRHAEDHRVHEPGATADGVAPDEAKTTTVDVVAEWDSGPEWDADPQWDADPAEAAGAAARDAGDAVAASPATAPARQREWWR